MAVKQLSVLSFIYLLSISLFGQKSALTWSDPIDKFHPNYPVSIGVCSDVLVFSQVINEARKERRMLILDKQNLSIREFKQLADLRGSFLHNFIFQWPCGSLLISSTHQSEQSKLMILLEQLSEQGIVRSNEFAFQTAIRPTPSSRIEACVNKAQNKIAIFHFEQVSVNTPIKLHLLIVDDAFEPIKEVVVEFQARNYLPEQTSSLLDADGNLHILMAYREGGATQYKILALPILSDDIVEYSLDLPERNIVGINFSLNEKEELVSTGIYASERISPQRALGLFYFRIDRETGDVAARNLQDFNYKMEPLSIPVGSGVKRSDFQNFKVKRVENLPDGSSIMFAEQNYTEQICNNDFRSGGIVCNDVDISGDMLIVKFSERGEVLWFEKRSKQIETIDTERKFSGSASFMNRDQLLLIYNDHKKNKISGKGSLVPLSSGQLHKGVIRFSFIQSANEDLKSFVIDNKGIIVPDIQAESAQGERYLMSIQKNNFRLLRLRPDVFQ
ncbi:MAG: hypothetical protein ACK4GL_00585 [Flavobacteriales bacterium]